MPGKVGIILGDHFSVRPMVQFILFSSLLFQTSVVSSLDFTCQKDIQSRKRNKKLRTGLLALLGAFGRYEQGLLALLLAAFLL